jgi:hypothetical protein
VGPRVGLVAVREKERGDESEMSLYGRGATLYRGEGRGELTWLEGCHASPPGSSGTGTVKVQKLG